MNGATIRLPRWSVPSRCSPYPARPAWRRRPRGWLAVLLWPLALAGAELTPETAGPAGEAPRSFDVPAGPARLSLKLTAQQAGVEIVFGATVAEGVTTPALRGEFPPRRAVERLLASTPLLLVVDTPSGVWSVVRRPPPTPAAEAAPPSPPMNPRPALARLGTWLALVLAPAAPGAAAETAALTGRVLNATTGQYLNNARISVRGTDLVAFTDQTGTYRLPRVPAGDVTL